MISLLHRPVQLKVAPAEIALVKIESRVDRQDGIICSRNEDVEGKGRFADESRVVCFWLAVQLLADTCGAQVQLRSKVCPGCQLERD